MYTYAHQKLQDFKAIPDSDSKLFFYIPSSYQGQQCEISLRVSQNDPLDHVQMKYKVKEVQVMEQEVDQQTHLLPQSIRELMNEFEVAQEIEQLPFTQTRQNNLLAQKYTPKTFSDLISDEKINREVLTWLKAWEQQQQPGQQMNILFRKTLSNVYQFETATGQGQDLANQIILLAGPPGTGKSTLARVIAGMCNYECVEINASDERTSENLINRIEMMCNNKNITKSEKNTLVILDEVDGALESESQVFSHLFIKKGAINKLLEYIFLGKIGAAPTKTKKKYDLQKQETIKSDDADILAMMNQPTSKLHIKRPVIFICNDPYAKGLRELRKKAIVFYFKRNQQDDRLPQRLKHICQKERIKVDQQTLLKICVANDYDIRACLGAIQMIALGSNSELFTLNFTKTIFQHLGDVFFDSAQSQTSQQLMNNLTKQIETNLLSEATFANYVQIKSTTKKFDQVPTFLNYLCLADTLEKNKLKYNFELTRFITLPQVFFSLKMKSHDKSLLQFPLQQIEFRRKKKLCEDIIDSLTQNIRDSSLKNKQHFSQSIPSYLYQIIQPKQELVELFIDIQNIMTAPEKKDLMMSLSIMLAFNLQVLNRPIQLLIGDNQFMEINFTPQIERIITFSDITLNKTINDRSRVLMVNLMPLVKIGILNKTNGNKKQQKDKEQDYLDKYDQMNSKRKKFAGPDEIHRKIIFRYQEGQSTPILYPLKMNFFFQ